MSNSTNNSGGIGILGLLGIVFVTLKLCGVITWSWWYVTLPFWGGLALALVGVVIYLIAGVVCIVVKELQRKRKS